MKSEDSEMKLSDQLRDESSSNAKLIKKVVKIGCCVNALLMVLKILSGYFGHSDALMADGFHSLNDLAADIIMLIFVGISYHKADNRYSYGYGKFETFSSFLISSFLIVVAFMIGREGVGSIIEYAHGEELAQPDIWTVIVVLIAMTCKEGLFRFYSYMGKKADCNALVANAWHHRSDALASVATLIGVSFSHFLGPGFRILDPIATVLIAIFIIIPAVRLFIPAFKQLMEHSLSNEIQENVNNIVSKTGGVEAISYIRTRRVGHKLVFDIGIKVNPDIKIEDGIGIVESIESQIKNSFCQHVCVSVAFTR